jgi:hypothetical protein
MLTVAEINRELREIADYNLKVYTDMVYDEFVSSMYENELIRYETERFYDEEALFYGEKGGF